jgi:hypothetical protein
MESRPVHDALHTTSSSLSLFRLRVHLIEPVNPIKARVIHESVRCPFGHLLPPTVKIKDRADWQGPSSCQAT